MGINESIHINIDALLLGICSRDARVRVHTYKTVFVI